MESIKMKVDKIRNGSNNTQNTVVISRWSIPLTYVWHTTGIISHAANGSSKEVCCNKKKKWMGVEVTADFVSTAGTLTIKEGGGIGVEAGGDKGKVSGNISWEITQNNTGFTVQPSAKYRLCPD